MMADEDPAGIELIPVDRINVVNPRLRNKKTFREIVSNIAQIGLKRPITVTPRQAEDGVHYDLVCGQGRLEAYLALGQKEIPAIIIEAGAEDCLIMSLVENLARRQHRAIDLLRDIGDLKKRGYSDTEIASKTGLSYDYVHGVARLLERGELRLLRAVEHGQIPLSIAMEIADADDQGLQRALQQAYEEKKLRGRKLIAARRLVDQRRLRGKGLRQSPNRTRPLSSEALVRVYQTETNKKRLLVRKAETTRDRLVFITEALRKLFADEHFVTLLRAEDLDTLPRYVAERISGGQGSS
jgi:ParB family transcriptional regulator, chromosome partitioning protein